MSDYGAGYTAEAACHPRALMFVPAPADIIRAHARRDALSRSDNDDAPSADRTRSASDDAMLYKEFDATNAERKEALLYALRRCFYRYAR